MRYCCPYSLWCYRYMSEVSSCSYKNGKQLSKWSRVSGQSEYHTFPVIIRSEGGELLTSTNSTSTSTSSTSTSIQQYDTMIFVNVLEHVQDAFRFLTGVFLSINPGGILIMHERYYNLKTVLDADKYHPVRVTRPVFDKFLSGFQILFNNCSASYEGRNGEEGYYIVARKISLWCAVIFIMYCLSFIVSRDHS